MKDDSRAVRVTTIRRGLTWIVSAYTGRYKVEERRYHDTPDEAMGFARDWMDGRVSGKPWGGKKKTGGGGQK